MATMLFTEISVRALKGSDQYVTYFDSKTPGFGIRVGKRSKTFVIVRGRSRERISIGHYPDIRLPMPAPRRSASSRSPTGPKNPRMTFKKARHEHLASFQTSDHQYHLALIFKKHFATLDSTQLAEIEDGDIRQALDKITGPSARLHAFRAIRAFFRWAIRPPRRHLRHNPMDGYEAPGSDKKGTRTLSDSELKAVWKAVESPTERVFRLMILWGTRNGETVAIQRSWIEGGLLTIPGSYTKNGRDHAIPILPMAKEVLDSLPVRTMDDGTNCPYFFPGRSNEAHITPHSLAKVMRQIQKDNKLSGFTIRDIRRTFRSNMARLKVPRDVCEVLINHAPPVLDEIYDRYDRIAEKREALEKYEAFMVRLLAQG